MGEMTTIIEGASVARIYNFFSYECIFMTFVIGYIFGCLISDRATLETDEKLTADTYWWMKALPISVGVMIMPYFIYSTIQGMEFRIDSLWSIIHQLLASFASVLIGVYFPVTWTKSKKIWVKAADLIGAIIGVSIVTLYLSTLRYFNADTSTIDGVLVTLLWLIYDKDIRRTRLIKAKPIKTFGQKQTEYVKSRIVLMLYIFALQVIAHESGIANFSFLMIVSIFAVTVTNLDRKAKLRKIGKQS